VLKDGASVDEDALIDWCLDHLARYKCPTKILFVDSLPKNVNGKLMRIALV
jgi:long-chain acyl-CoA synthetase